MKRLLFVLGTMLFQTQAWGYVSLQASPSYVNFGSVPVNWPLQSEYIQITNWGNEPAKSLSVYAICGGEFHVTDMCFSDLQPNQSCTVTVNFRSDNPGNYSCSVDVYALSAGSTRIQVQASVEEPAL